ncbi:hypothetical protein GDO81_029648 [Engystomops pustulosus]|uniref:Uncharacterized protein n=1 Tax=Engystomops pustulosus TaxID=76066 RepID=A0AAV6YM07_ENGPU|nr:hypothetical protein GDO81_029648 [Engystomops pustulosus]
MMGTWISSAQAPDQQTHCPGCRLRRDGRLSADTQGGHPRTYRTKYLTLTKLSGKAPRLPLISPSIQPSSSSFLTFLMMSPTRIVSSSSCTAS